MSAKPAKLTPELIVRASNVAMEQHAGQKRKYTGDLGTRAVARYSARMAVRATRLQTRLVAAA